MSSQRVGEICSAFAEQYDLYLEHQTRNTTARLGVHTFHIASALPWCH